MSKEIEAQAERSNYKQIVPEKIGKRIRYYLGDKYPDIYLTSQEAKCMYYCIKKFTSKKTSVIMSINHRTVEYYRGNIRCKLGAASKKDLLDKIKKSDFLNYFNHLNKICKDS